MLFFLFVQLNLGIYTKDKESEFSMLVDRATGGASIKDGEVELMLHRYSSYLFIAISILLFYCKQSINTMFTTQGVFSMMIVEELGNHLMNKFA